MGFDALYLGWIFLLNAPYLAIVLILAHYLWRRAAWRHGRRLGRKRLGYYPSAFAFGMALQFVQVFYRPSVDYVLETKRDEAAEEDDEGDPETGAKELSRQLKRIRRGERVESLVLRL
ncbi:MAG: hypothetical protein WBQ94_06635 [Terracidiphilus sp.]